MSSAIIRKKFLEFFISKDHKLFPSDSLIPSTDATMLFTSAGMVQFKPYFTGEIKTGLKRSCSVQKCFRTTDIEKVGKTNKHLTFFEMLGNFSFGDYFKEDAINWGLEFLTKQLNINPKRLYATIYKEDEEAYNIWKKFLPQSRIYKLSEETNFWMMGETGPCGPCSEIIFDFGEEKRCSANCEIGVCDCDRWLEVWNLVFTQFDRQKDGKLLPLPKKNIDTGMGLERLVTIAEEKKSIFEIDLFQPIKNEITKNLNTQPKDEYLNLIADHIRGATFLIAEGVIPSNESRGYILRRILRRAIRTLKLLNADSPHLAFPLLYKISDVVIKIMKDVYQELLPQRNNISVIIKTEEEKFLETLETGTRLLDELILESNKKTISGKEIFHLYETYGFPYELTKEILDEKNITIDEEEFQQAKFEAQKISQKSWTSFSPPSPLQSSIYQNLKNKIKTEFIYTDFSITSTILSLIEQSKEVEKTKSQEVEIILNITPFYAQSGGQVGDKGIIKTSDNKNIAEVIDTFSPEEGIIVHKVKIKSGSFQLNQQVIAEVDLNKRIPTMRNHTATHLLHKALREILGSNVVQAGSLVESERLRFDYTSPKPLTESQVIQIEDLVNTIIKKNIPVIIKYMNLDDAKRIGAMALFGEKYTQTVRCVMISSTENPKDAYSIELCGGTHVNSTGEIGIFKIISESSISAGVRRIEAITGDAVLNYIRNLENTLDKIAITINSPKKELLNKLNKLIQERKSLQQKILDSTLTNDIDKLIEKVTEFGETKIIFKKIDNLDFQKLASLADKIKEKAKKIYQNYIIGLFSKYEKETQTKKSILLNFVVICSEAAIKNGFSADKIAKTIGRELDGSGGGRDDFARGGGKNIEKFENILTSPEVLLNISTQ